MPTYEYECQACGHKFEKFQSITAAPVRTCPQCHKRKVRRLISAGAGIIFKGSGFYQTDYRSESYKQAAAKDKPVVPSSASSASSGESKPSGGESKAETLKKSADGSGKSKKG